MSRRFYIIAKADPKTPLEQCARLVDQLEKYGVDADSEDCTFTFKGDITIDNLLYEQCKSVLHALWNCMIGIEEVGELIEDCSFVIHVREDKKTIGLSNIFDKMADWVERDPEDIYDEYLETAELEESEDDLDEEDVD